MSITEGQKLILIVWVFQRLVKVGEQSFYICGTKTCFEHPGSISRPGLEDNMLDEHGLGFVGPALGHGGGKQGSGGIDLT
ncbi:MAG: hypothetical protein IIB14_07355 [Chloroflexi bacterium]|nr:hypothetical protein [Chloroflexota bacterium]